MKKKILVIEDRKDSLELIKFGLRKLGYTVIGTFNGEEGLAMLEKDHIGLIILDALLPDMHGKEVLKKIRANKKYDEIKILILSSLNLTEKDKKELLEEGAQSIVLKPITVEQLDNEIKKILKQEIKHAMKPPN